MNNTATKENQYYINGFRELEKNDNRTADYKEMASPSARKLVAKIKEYKRKEIVWCIVSGLEFISLVWLFILYLKK